jgi:hypothetical protein
MKTSVLDTQESTNKRWAAQDARMRNIVNASHYSEQTKIRTERMKFALELCYKAKNIYVAFGKKGVSIKVDNAWVKDNVNLALLEQDWEAQGVTKKVSAQGVIYRLTAA